MKASLSPAKEQILCLSIVSIHLYHYVFMCMLAEFFFVNLK